MQIVTEQTERKLPRYIPFLIYLIGGLLIVLLGGNTFKLFPTNKNLLYEWGLTLFLLLLAVVMQRIPRLQIYKKIASALFIASFANALNLSLGNFLGRILDLSGNDMRFLAFDKLSQAIPIILAIILLTLWSGDDLWSLFLKTGNLRQGLKFGFISFGVFVVIFVIIVVFQASGPPAAGWIA